MSVEILQTFHQRMMPLFTPQAERLVDQLSPNSLNEIAFRYTFSVDAMTKISHIIEDAAIQTAQPADLHASFQYLSRLKPQLDRYREVALRANGLWLYSELDTKEDDLLQLIASPRVAHIDTKGTPLVNYWYVVAYGNGIHMSLLAQEIPSMSGNERYYEGFYTFKADVAYQLVSILHQIYPQQVPPPVPLDF
jgi:hypothetical protein